MKSFLERLIHKDFRDSISTLASDNWKLVEIIQIKILRDVLS